MKYIKILVCYMLASQLGFANTHDHSRDDTGNDPIELSRKIINEQPVPWASDTHKALHLAYDAYKTASFEAAYILLESPPLAPAYFQSGFISIGESISKEHLLAILKQAAHSPDIASKIVAKAAIQQGLQEYTRAFEIVNTYKRTSELSYKEAVVFLSNRFGYAKLADAKNLMLGSAESYQSNSDTKNGKLVSAKLKEIGRKYPNQIPMNSALTELAAFYKLLEEVQMGLPAYQPYAAFKRAMDDLNTQRINQQRSLRSDLEITYPDRSTTWTIPNAVEISWNTKNIPENKTIKFYLSKDDMVVQELGIFENNSFKEGIYLNKTLATGTNYRVIGIELFPADPFHTAKYATPLFTINKETPKKDIEELVPVIEKVAIDQKKVDKSPEKQELVVKKVERQPLPTTKELPQKATEDTAMPSPPKKEVIEVTEKPAPLRDLFDGRNISYVKELAVEGEEIRISLWDHGRMDGDIVSIYLNGEAIVAKHSLTYKKTHYDLKLDASKPNDLFLYAHNLGKYPPNTVSIEISDGKVSENIVLNSDLKSCEAVLINVKK